MPDAVGFLPALLWIGLFSAFALLFLLPMRRRDWRSAGMYEAFLIALFTEMFGFPLAVYLLSGALGLPGPVPGTTPHPLAFVFGGEGIGMTFVLVLVAVLVFSGAALVLLGWRAVYRSPDHLVTTGLYARVRHPQYLGLLLLTMGLLVWWPTVLTVPMWPLVAWMYVRLARREEADLLGNFGSMFEAYRASVPAFLPGLRPRRESG